MVNLKHDFAHATSETRANVSKGASTGAALVLPATIEVIEGAIKKNDKSKKRKKKLSAERNK